MKILKIEQKQKTEKEDYTLITFKTWWGRKFTEVCITSNWNISTDYAKSGESIPVSLWPVVKAFLRTNDKSHKY
jgi:hypothetical protein